MSYERRVYRAPSGQWSWEITQDGEHIVGVIGGYDTEFEAQTDADAELAHLEARDIPLPDDPQYDEKRAAIDLKHAEGLRAMLDDEVRFPYGSPERAHLAAGMAALHMRATVTTQAAAHAVTTQNNESKWQPIETAPKDGTEVALLFAREIEFIGRKYSRVWAALWCGDWSLLYMANNPPIGWQPLPTAPAVLPGEQAENSSIQTTKESC